MPLAALATLNRNAFGDHFRSDIIDIVIDALMGQNEPRFGFDSVDSELMLTDPEFLAFSQS
jgi:hypothetical protein